MKKLSKIFAIFMCLILALGVCVLPSSAENNAQLHDDMTDWSRPLPIPKTGICL